MTVPTRETKPKPPDAASGPNMAEVLAALLAFLKANSGQGQGAAGLQGQAQLAANLMVQSKQRKKSMALPYDENFGGLRMLNVFGKGSQRRGGGLLTGSNATIFTADQPYRDVVLVISNIDVADRTFQLNHVPAAASAGDSNALFKATTIRAGFATRFELPGINTNETLQGLCSSASKVCVTVYGAAPE